MLDVTDVYHTGFVVPDIPTAMAEFTAVFGLTWTAVEEREMPVVTPEGPRVVTLRFAYSQGGTPRIELLEPVPGTAWETPSHSFGAGAAHHIGVWAPEFAATSEKLVAAGFPRVLTFDDGSGGAARFAYHRLPSGAIVELIDATRRRELEAWFAGAAYPAASSD
jgi:catechol 2,3-dioxygenase-like lactoylglutathione lyase family enzyme